MLTGNIRSSPSCLLLLPEPSRLLLVADSQALTFFDGNGAALNETELPSSATAPPYSRIAVMDAGTGPFWVIVFGDGSIHAFSLQGRRLSTDETGLRFATYTVMPRRGRPSLLVTVGEGGVIAWSADPATLRW